VKRDGVGLRVLTGTTVPPDLAYAPGALATLRQSLAGGWTAIVPERPVSLAGVQRTGWWLVDATTGRTADQMDDGRGEVNPYAATLRVAQVSAEALVPRAGLWRCVIGSVLVTEGVLAAGLGGESGGTLGLLGGVAGAGGVGLGVWLITSCVG
jgi:hypothetical protein